MAERRHFKLVFDGGSHGNPGRSYGSFHVRPWKSKAGKLTRVEFGQGTNNEAEYWTLQTGLRALRAFLEGAGVPLSQVELEIRGDSQLVIFQVEGRWKAKDARMRALRDETRGLLKGFGKVVLLHHERSESVRLLGH